MSALVKQLLLDSSMHARSISLDLYSDLIRSVQDVLTSEVFKDKAYSRYLDLYLSGYNSTEIALLEHTTTAHVEELLHRVFTAIEHISGYTDEAFIERAKQQVIYRRSKLPEFIEYIERKSKDFTHEN